VRRRRGRARGGVRARARTRRAARRARRGRGRGGRAARTRQVRERGLADGGRVSREYPDYPRVGVGAVILHEDKVLLVRRGKAPSFGKWSLPGGLVELGETTHEAISREIREECGIKIRVVDVAGVIDRVVKDDADRVRYHYVLVDYLAYPDSLDVEAGDDAAEAQWFEIGRVADLDTTQGLLDMIRRAEALRGGTRGGKSTSSPSSSKEARPTASSSGYPPARRSWRSGWRVGTERRRGSSSERWTWRSFRARRGRSLTRTPTAAASSSPGSVRGPRRPPRCCAGPRPRRYAALATSARGP